MKKIKLIIDISEEEYKNVLKFTDCYAFGYVIANGRPLQEEFEEIKAEIEDLLSSYGYLDMHTNNDVLEIIDKRIAELKGENKE